MDDQKKLTIDRFTVLAHKHPPMPIQPAPLSWMGNEYWLNGSDYLQLESMAYSTVLFVWMASKTHLPLSRAIHGCLTNDCHIVLY